MMTDLARVDKGEKPRDDIHFAIMLTCLPPLTRGNSSLGIGRIPFLAFGHGLNERLLWFSLAATEFRQLSLIRELPDQFLTCR